jgi:hypothetical protein
MRFEIYCDESSHDRLTKEQERRNGFFFIGGIWIPAEHRLQLKESIRNLQDIYQTHGELKWNRVCPSRLQVYQSLIDVFFDSPARFRCVAIECKKVDLLRYDNSDAELGFYKFYYQLLHHWITDFNEYSVFVDFKINRDPSRLKTLHRVLEYGNLAARVARVQALNSGESPFIQLVDVLTGAVGHKFHRHTGSASKAVIVKRIEHRLKRPISPTGPFETKFNVFQMNLQGGW